MRFDLGRALMALPGLRDDGLQRSTPRATKSRATSTRTAEIPAYLAAH